MKSSNLLKSVTVMLRVWLDLHAFNEELTDFGVVVRRLCDHELVLLLIDEHVVRQ